MPALLKQIPAGADVYTLALERTAEILSRFDKVLVLFSGGKDSSAALEVTLEVARSDPRFTRHLPLRAVFQDEEAIPFETEEYVRRTFARPDVAGEWYCLPVKHRNACSRTHPWWWPWAPEDEAKWTRPLPPEAITELAGFPINPPEARLTTVEMNGLLAPPSSGNVGMITGIRAPESLTRRRIVTSKKVDNYITRYCEDTSRGNLWKCYPIYDWTTEDVWTYPSIKGHDYNCNVYEAPIWMSDYSFKPIGEVRAGDKIIGWKPVVGARSKGGNARDHLVRATVLATHKRHSKVVKVTTESGRTIRCTPDHLWMHYRCGHSRPDGKGGDVYSFAAPGVGHNLCHVVDLPDTADVDGRTAAWLAGIYDGEASGASIYQSPDHNPQVYAEIETALNKLGISYGRLNNQSNSQKGFRITGGRSEIVRFLNLVQPVRRVTTAIDKIVLGGRFRTPDRIVAIEDDGEADVYALTTTTGNYVCWGYASKNSAYDRLEMAGISHSLQRCSPAFGEEPLQKLHTYAACFPDVWEKMAERVPGVGAAVRYALTELYSYHGRPEKPVGMPWPEFIAHYLRKYPAKDAAMIATRIRHEISRHYLQTSNPIVVGRPYPDTGVSWNWLLMLAMRGDYKGRKQAGGRIQTMGDRRAQPVYWHKYADELAEIIDAGTFPELAAPLGPPADPYALIPEYARVLAASAASCASCIIVVERRTG